MGFFSKLGASMGIGGAKLTLAAVPQQVPQGGKVSVNMALVGGKVAQQVTSVKAQLVRLWHEEERVETRDADGSTHWETRTVTKHEVVLDKIVGQAMTIKPEQSEQYTAELEVPLDAIIDDRDNWWEVWGEGDVQKGKNAKEKVKLQIVPSEMITQFQVIVTEKLQWGFKDFVPGQTMGAVQMRYMPPAQYAELLDEIRCDLKNSPGQLYVTLVLDFKQKKFTDYFKAMVGKDDKAASLTLSADDLKSNEQAVVDAVNQKIQQLAATPPQ